MRQIITCLSLCFLLAGCKVEKNKAEFQSKNITRVEAKSSSIAKSEVESSHMATSIESTSTVMQFLKLAEKEFCESNNDNLSYCYESHSEGIKSDFLQQLPITISKPYDGPINWDKFNRIANFSGLWSKKCGFQNEKTGEELRFHCPNLYGEFGTWIRKVSQTNDLINMFYSEYNKNQDFSTSMQQHMFLTADTGLDFNDKDHRAFYWIFHIALAELRNADAKFKKMNN